MRLAFLLSATLALSGTAFAQMAAQMLNLSCVEALVAVDRAELAGVFSFIPEKDSPAAFADLVVHDKKALKKYLAKLKRDQKEAGGLTIWDNEAAKFAATLYKSPLAETFPKPGEAALRELDDLTRAPTMSLQEVTARRRAKG